MADRAITAPSLHILPCLALLAALCTIASSADAATLRVGPGRTYTTVRAASQAVADGDSVLIDAGLYSGDVTSWYASNLTILGVGTGRAHLDAAGVNEGGKGIWVLYGNNYTIENVEFSGATVPDQNGAGIRGDGGGNLFLRNCYFHDNEDGILAGADSMVIENSVFDHNGYGDGQSHNMYVWGRSFTIRDSYTHRAIIGHDIKTRSRNNYILYNRIMDESDGTASYEIDIPEGGRSYVIGNVIEQGPNTDNSAIIAYAAENNNAGVLDLYVINNTIVNDRTSGALFLQLRSGSTVTVRNNIFYGPGTLWSSGSTIVSSNNYVEPSYNNSPGFASPSTYDFHLTAASPATIVNAGAAPGVSVTGYPLAPTGQYVYDAQGTTRPTSGALDIGAFEYVSGGGSDTTAPASIEDLRTP